MMAGDRADSKAAPERFSAAVQSAGFEPLTSKTVNPQGKRHAAHEDVAMSINVPFQIAEHEGPSSVNRMTQPKRGANFMQGADAPISKRSLLTFDPNSNLDEHFAVEDCAASLLAALLTLQTPRAISCAWVWAIAASASVVRFLAAAMCHLLTHLTSATVHLTPPTGSRRRLRPLCMPPVPVWSRLIDHRCKLFNETLTQRSGLTSKLYLLLWGPTTAVFSCEENFHQL
jgi:hypothetical protein